MSDKYIEIAILFATSNLLLPVFAMIIIGDGIRNSGDGFLKDFFRVWCGIWAIILMVAAIVSVVCGFFWSVDRLFFEAGGL
jgi:hypothetical protein